MDDVEEESRELRPERTLPEVRVDGDREDEGGQEAPDKGWNENPEGERRWTRRVDELESEDGGEEEDGELGAEDDGGKGEEGEGLLLRGERGEAVGGGQGQG